MFANDINFISLIDLRQVSPGLKSLLEVIPLRNILTPSLWINIAAAAVEVNIASEPHASSSITSSGMFLSKRNLFSPVKTAFSPDMGWNCLNKKPIKIIIKDENNENKYEINSENAFYNLNTESVSFEAKDKRVKSIIYF